VSEVELSRDIFDNARGYEKLARAYEPRNAALGVLVPALVTLVLTGLHALFPSAGSLASLEAPWLLVALHVPAITLTGRMFRARRRAAFQRAYWLQSLVQYLWLQFLCWHTTPFFALVGVMIFCAWAFNDAWFFYDTRPIKLQYLLAFPIFDALLLGVDLAGGAGLLDLLHRDARAFAALISVQLVLAVVLQVILDFVGSTTYAHDRGVLAQSLQERELAVMRAERAVLQESSVYLAHGLSAAKFSHDVGTPLQYLVSNLGLLAEMFERPPPSASLAKQWAEAREILADAVEGAHKVRAMSDELARSIKTRESPAPTPVRALVDRALEASRADLAARGLATPDARLDLEDADVVVTAGHAGTLANLLTNGSLQRPDAPLDVRGRALNPWFYHLALRDHGVEPDARPDALAAIQRALTFEPPRPPSATEPPKPRAYEGYGLALTMARVLLGRYDGALGVGAPDSGRGVVLHVILPRLPQAEIPAGADAPEAALNAALAPMGG
jgi:hypothetical protein